MSKKKKKKNYKIYSKDNREYMMESFLRDEFNGDGNGDGFDDFLDLSFDFFGVESTFKLYGMALRKMKEVLDDAKK